MPIHKRPILAAKPQPDPYILAVIYHSLAKPPDKEEIQRVIERYGNMNWRLVSSHKFMQPFDDGYTVLKFCKG